MLQYHKSTTVAPPDNRSPPTGPRPSLSGASASNTVVVPVPAGDQPTTVVGYRSSIGGRKQSMSVPPVAAHQPTPSLRVVSTSVDLFGTQYSSGVVNVVDVLPGII